MTDHTPRVPPHSLEAELAVLGSVLLDNDMITTTTLSQLQPADFYREGHQKIFATFAALREARTDDGQPGSIDLITLKNELERRGQLDEVGGLTYLIGLSEGVPTSAYADQYARIVLEKATLRRKIVAANAIARACYDQHLPLEEIDALTSTIPNLELGETPVVSASEVLKGVLDQAANGTGSRGAPSGLTDLDRMMRGFEPTRLYVLAARPSMGKTAAAYQFGVSVARTAGRVLSLSLEMPPEEIVARIVASEARVDLARFSDARMGDEQLTDRDWARLTAAHEFIDGLPLDIVKTQSVMLHELVDLVRKEHRKAPLSMFILDYLQLVRVSGRGGGNRTQEVSEISRELKSLALELKIPVLALSQLSRSVEQRPDRRPMLSDLRESGAIEQDADVVMFIYRDEYYNKETHQHGIAEFILGKQRNGPTGTVKTQFHSAFTRFNDLAQEHWGRA